MGAVHFSIDPRLARLLVDELELSTFVETGTYLGDSVAAAMPLFEELHTVELSEELAAKARQRFREEPRVHVHQGDSAGVLAGLRPRLEDKPTLFWLDAHWCDPDATPPPDECPLLRELEAIGTLRGNSVVLIDDARLFMAPPPPPARAEAWPQLGEVVQSLRAMGPEHDLMVIDDVIAFYPRSVAGAIGEHAREHSIDLLVELQRARQVRSHDEHLFAQIAAMNQVQERTAAELQERLSELHAEIDALGNRVEALARPRWQSARREAWRIRVGRLRPTPKLGRLKHHPPMELSIPGRYYQQPKLVDPPSISIVTPSLNQAQFLGQTIESVLSQGYPSHQYIVQDGGSSDGTAEILQRFEDRIDRCVSALDGGQGNAINLGMAHATGEVLAYLNSDDLLLPGALHYVGDYFDRHPGVDVIYGHRVLIDEDGKEIGRWVLPRHDDRVLSWADFIPQETLFWRRGVWEAAGGQIDESFRFALDWDLVLRMRDAGARIVRVPRFLGAFRVHEEQKSTASMASYGQEEMMRIRSREHSRPVPVDEVSRHIRGYLARHVVLHKLYRAGVVRY